MGVGYERENIEECKVVTGGKRISEGRGEGGKRLGWRKTRKGKREYHSLQTLTPNSAYE